MSLKGRILSAMSSVGVIVSICAFAYACYLWRRESNHGEGAAVNAEVEKRVESLEQRLGSQQESPEKPDKAG